jgi:hypothetical protein
MIKILVMRTTFGFLIIAIIASLSFTSCVKDLVCKDGEGGIETRTFDLDPFQGIILEESAYVTIKQSDTQKVTVTGHQNILDRLKQDVEGSIWEIDLGRGCFDDYELKIDIEIPDLKRILLSGSGDIIVDDFDEQGDLDILISGSGYIKLGSFSGTEEVNVSIPGSGEVYASSDFPDLKDLDLNIPGSGEFQGYNMVTDNCDVTISGSGDVYVYVTEYLKVLITGSGDVHYRGDPDIDVTITGSGDVINDN